MRKYESSFKLLYDIGNRKESMKRGGLNKAGRKKPVTIKSLKFLEKKNGDKRA